MLYIEINGDGEGFQTGLAREVPQGLSPSNHRYAGEGMWLGEGTWLFNGACPGPDTIQGRRFCVLPAVMDERGQGGTYHCDGQWSSSE